jgi:ATP-dependent Clp protease ATP-binding subunit ClpB
MVRIDMSEFMEQHSVARLIGAPPGYVGYEEGGYLTEAVRRRPYSLLLLDEVEKAHPDVFNILLQVLEDGRLTDGQGRTVDFRNTVVVMTSNLGSEHIREVLDEGQSDGDTGALQATLQAKVMSDVAMHFRPEFLNRIDESVIFHALGQEHIRQIAGLQLRALKARLADRSLSLSINDEVMAYLADQGFDPVYGARPLKRAIQRLIENPLAESLLAGDFEPGDVIEVSRGGQEMQFLKAAKVSQVA